MAAAEVTPSGPPAKRGAKEARAAEAAIRLTGVVKRFGVKAAVDGVSLSVPVGSVFGLIGPNGAGKTTTFSMIAGYLKPTEGSIDVLGYPPTMLEDLRSRLGVLPQDALLPAGDRVGEFLVHMARLQGVAKEDAEREAKSVLAEVSGNDWWGQRCGSLSHGMAKRVALAQALLGDPDVLLLDEPTSGLDPRVAWEMRQLITSRKGKSTIVISSHNLQELEAVCDEAAILDRGRVVTSGTIASLTSQSHEVHFKIAPPVEHGPRAGLMASLPMEKLRAISLLKRLEFDEERSELVVYFEPGSTDAETVIAHVLWLLLNEKVRISGVSKGRSLEQRVMDLT
jgi:ABC-2 type transport system ATP-binding protein